MARVLLIDDDPQIRTVCRLLLQCAGFTVTEASNGEEGLRVFGDQPAEVVLCDVFMPGQDGLELIRQLHRQFPEVRIIAMSGGAFAGSMDLLPVARRLGAAAILHKPFQVSEVLETIRRVLDTSTASR